MDQEMSEQVLALKEALDQDPRVQELAKCEQEMEADEEVMKLSYRFSRAQDDYNDALRHYAETDEEVKEAQHRLFEAKKVLDSHPKVRAYLTAFGKVRLMYEQMQKDLFDPFNVTCHEKR